jgi:hypothetical protein
MARLGSPPDARRRYSSCGVRCGTSSISGYFGGSLACSMIVLFALPFTLGLGDPADPTRVGGHGGLQLLAAPLGDVVGCRHPREGPVLPAEHHVTSGRRPDEGGVHRVVALGRRIGPDTQDAHPVHLQAGLLASLSNRSHERILASLDETAGQIPDTLTAAGTTLQGQERLATDDEHLGRQPGMGRCRHGVGRRSSGTETEGVPGGVEHHLQLGRVPARWHRCSRCTGPPR